MKTSATAPEKTMSMTVEGLRLDRASPIGLDADAVVEMLRQVSFLAQVSPATLRHLVDAVPLRTYPTGGEVLMRQGEYGHSLFILLGGGVTVESEQPGESAREVARISTPGSTFGEGAVLGRRRRSATVRTLGPSVLLELDKTRIERLDMASDGVVLPPIEVLAELRELNAFVESHRFFALMSGESRQAIKAHARLNTYGRGETVFRRGDRAETIYIVRTGTAELVSQSDDAAAGRHVVNYLTVGDAVGLAAGVTHRHDLVSRGYLELFELARNHLLGLDEADREILRRFHKDAVDIAPIPSAPEPDASAQLTAALFQQGMITDGAQEGLSLLTIDLDACIRCGNCVRACQSRHGKARFERKGEKLVRRVDSRDDKRHQAVLLPSSCRHCVDPVCMIDCPTGAIHRTARGEVVIEDTCIGCASCANRCPWGNITMAETPGRLVDGIMRNHQAHKCDLCAGYDEPNCVHNCPTGAILRVEPTSFYPELREMLGRTGQVALPRTKGDPATPGGGRKRRRALEPLAWIVGAAAVGGTLYRAAPDTYSPWSTPGLVLGGLTAANMAGALMLAVRRRRAGARRSESTSWIWRRLAGQWGSFLGWSRAHVGFGLASLVFLLLHCGVRGGGALTTALLTLSVGEVALGIFGAVFGRWMPRVITRLEAAAQVEDDARAEWVQRKEHLCVGRETLTADQVRALDAVASVIPSRSARLWSHLGYGLGGRIRRKRRERAGRRRLPRHLEERHTFFKGEVRRFGAGLSAEDYISIDRLVEDHLRIVDLGVCLWLYHIRHTWLGLHIGVASAICILALAHILTVVTFLTGGGA